MKTRGLAKYAFVNHLDKKYEQWKITLVLDPKEVKKLKAAGLKPKKVIDEETDEITTEITFNRYLKRKKSDTLNKKPKVLDAALNPYDGMIGNGSEVIVVHKPFSWTFKGKEGMSSDLCTVQVIKLVEYEGKVEEDDPDDELEAVDGFVAEQSESDEDELQDETDVDEDEDEPEY